MATPDLFEMREPTLSFLAEQPKRHVNVKQELASAVAERLSAAKGKSSSPEGYDIESFPNFVDLLCSGLSRSGLIERTKYGCVRITRAGKDYVDDHYANLSEADRAKERAAREKWKAARKEFLLRERELANCRPAHEKRKAGVG